MKPQRDGVRSTREGWLERHPYLRRVAEFRARVEAALDAIVAPAPAIPNWDDHSSRLADGVPALRHAISLADLAPVGAMTVTLAARLGEDASADPDRIVPWLLGEDDLIPPDPVLLRYLGWTAAARWLAPVVRSFDAWRDEERWQRSYCPFCASLPVMAQLAGTDPGKRRLLACGCCASRWQFRRTACPFCEADPQRLPSLTIESEPELRIDHCTACGGYLKTYVGEGHEDLMLSDWSSLHLDVIARNRGLVRAAVSLYDLSSTAA